MAILFFSVDATWEVNRLCRYVNDSSSSKANTKMEHFAPEGGTRLCLVAIKDIAAGTELRYDYGDQGLPWRKVCINMLYDNRVGFL